MPDKSISFTRWYDEDPVVSKCIKMLESIQDSAKRQTATFLLNEIVTKQPYSDMLPDEILNLVINEENKRRWYDFDEIIKIFMELLRHCPQETKKEIAITAISFIESLSFDKNKSVEIETIEE